MKIFHKKLCKVFFRNFSKITLLQLEYSDKTSAYISVLISDNFLQNVNCIEFLICHLKTNLEVTLHNY